MADDERRSDNDRRDNQFGKTRDICESSYDWSKLERNDGNNDRNSNPDEDRGTLDRPGDSRD